MQNPRSTDAKTLSRKRISLMVGNTIIHSAVSITLLLQCNPFCIFGERTKPFHHDFYHVSTRAKAIKLHALHSNVNNHY